MKVRAFWNCASACMLASAGSVHAACPATPVAQATSGYGANGSFGSKHVTFKNPPNKLKKVYVYYAPGAGARPTIMYSHPYGGTDPDFVGPSSAAPSVGYEGRA